MASRDRRIKPITVRCADCDTPYDWVPARDDEAAGEAPRCPKCAAPYHMACHDCGLDLTIDGYQQRPLKSSSDGPPIWGLFCPECTEKYDRFRARGNQGPPCAKCGAPVPVGELRLRSHHSTEVFGQYALHQTTYDGLCPTCAAAKDRGGRGVLWATVAAVVSFLLFVLVAWLLS
jgi:hypothetical protein